MAQAVAGANHAGHAVLKVDDFVGQVVIILRQRTLQGGEGVLRGCHKSGLHGLDEQPRGPHGQHGLLRLGGVQRLLHGEPQNEMWQGLNLGLHWVLLKDYLLFASGQPRQLQLP